MDILINGEKKELVEASTLSRLMETLALDKRRFAVERNGQVVPKSLYGTTMLADGDAIEIVQFIGGG